MPRVLLDLIWLASPALPVGGFSYSEGLEPAIEASLVATEAQAGDWLADQLQIALAAATWRWSPRPSRHGRAVTSRR
jgi:urease accessory protein